MHSHCIKSNIWMQNTFNWFIRRSCRSVSTTSAINRGLRATKVVDRRPRYKAIDKAAEQKATWNQNEKRRPFNIKGNHSRSEITSFRRPSRPSSPVVEEDKPPIPAAPTESSFDAAKNLLQERRLNEEAIQSSLDCVKEPLSILRKSAQPENNLEALSRSVEVHEIQHNLKFINTKFQDLLTRTAHRMLKTHLPQEFWSRDATEGTVPRLFFDRSAGTLGIVVKNGGLDGSAQILWSGEKLNPPGIEKSTRLVRKAQPVADEPMFKINDPSTTNDRVSTSPHRPSNLPVLDFEGDDALMPVPYTTAASVFIFGVNAVRAALKAKRRKLYKLYILDNRERLVEIRKLANDAGVSINDRASVRLLDKMSEDRPHNGVLLEASRLPAPPVLSLGSATKTSFRLQFGLQNADEKAVNGTADFVTRANSTLRFPFVVMLDGITDPGNVGSILRTCYFYGVDAVAIATNTCANLNSSVLAKASSGACEAIKIIVLPQPSAFAYNSTKAGWKVYAAVTPPVVSKKKSERESRPFLTTSTLSARLPLTSHPCILMLGAEGAGLRDNLKNRADHWVGIQNDSTNAMDLGIDSLNVSAAASVLLESFMRMPKV